jgi:multidrug efflux pump subunit AcrA (membrane-fusion protein)
MHNRTKIWLRRALVLPPIAVGLAVLAWMASGRDAPEHDQPVETAQAVRTITVQPLEYVPRAVGYGVVEPGTVWEAVAQVSGELVHRSPRLERGQVMPAEAEILRIDRTDYEIALEEIEANIASVEAQLTELDVAEENTRQSLTIERRAVALLERDLARKESLFDRGNISEAEVEAAERDLLNQRQRVQELENELARIPAQRRLQESNLALYEARRRDAALDLARTSITTPFPGRVAQVNVEETQFVNVGEVMAVIDSIDVAEVEAQLAIDRLRPLLRPGLTLSSLSPEEIESLPEQLGLGAEVRLPLGGRLVTWPARVDRMSAEIDPETRTIGAIVAVDDPYAQAVSGVRPPLVRNLYVEVELRGEARPGSIVVPRVAVHRRDDGRPVVYIADADDRLAFRQVVPGPAQGDLVVIAEGLQAGDRVIVTDVIPAIAGLRLLTSPDEALAERLRAEATAEGAGAPSAAEDSSGQL